MCHFPPLKYLTAACVSHSKCQCSQNTRPIHKIHIAVGPYQILILLNRTSSETQKEINLICDGVT